MSGHSKWHNIRLRKGSQDAKRSNLFTKLAKEIILAARSGGGNPDNNLRLRLAIQKARDNSMPSDNIKRSIQRGTGEIEGASFEELLYEGYGPGGAAILVECATDNKNRTVSNIRNIFSKNGGRLAESGSVSYRFSPIGLISVSKTVIDEEKLMEIVVEAGAEDVRIETETFDVICDPENFQAVRVALETANVPLVNVEYTLEPADMVEINAKDTEQMLKLMDKLDDDEDVQKIHVNVEFSDEVLAASV